MHTHTHTHTHAHRRTHARTHARAHTHKQTLKKACTHKNLTQRAHTHNKFFATYCVFTAHTQVPRELISHPVSCTQSLSHHTAARLPGVRPATAAQPTAPGKAAPSTMDCAATFKLLHKEPRRRITDLASSRRFPRRRPSWRPSPPRSHSPRPAQREMARGPIFGHG
jgi:hypothetical protein